MARIDKSGNTSEYENQVFELQSMKNSEMNKKAKNFKDRKSSVPSTLLNKNSLKLEAVSQRLKNRNHKNNREVSETKSRFIPSKPRVSSPVVQSPPRQEVAKYEIPPTVKYINEDSKLYEKYQNLYIEYEEKKKEISQKTIKIFLNIKNPNKLELHLGIVLSYFTAYLDRSIPQAGSKAHKSSTNFKIQNKNWMNIVTSLRKLTSKKILNY